MIDTSNLTLLISALRAETESASISPENMGYILQCIVDFLPNLDNSDMAENVAQAKANAISALNKAIEALNSATNASTNAANAQSMAADATTTAEQSKTTATTALNKAIEALNSATNASTNAANAQSMAADATTTAEQSKATAKAAADAVDILTSLVGSLQEASGEATQVSNQAMQAIAAFRDSKGKPSGIAPLDESGKVPEDFIPGHLAGLNEMGVLAMGQEQRLVVEFMPSPFFQRNDGVYFVKSENKIFIIVGKNTLTEDPSPNVVYCDKASGKLFRWDGTRMVQVGGVTYSDVQDIIAMTKPLTGKKVVMLGDSIHELKTEGEGIVEHFSEMSGATVYGCAVGDARLSRRNTAGYDVPDVVDALTSTEGLTRLEGSLKTAFANGKSIYNTVASVDITDVDIVTILAGTNDWASDSPEVSLGTDEDATEVNNISGAVKYIIDNLLMKNPRVKIFFFTPIPCMYGADPRNFTDSYIPRAGGYLLPELCNRVKEVCRLRHIPCCDMYWDLGWNEHNLLTFAPVNGRNPMQGYREIAEKELAFILSKG